MLKNYLKTALRSLLRHKGYSGINITGLAVGMTCCILIMLWIQYQFSYDEFHTNINNLYWVPVLERTDSGMMPSYQSPPALGPALKEEFPEVADAARACPFGEQFVKYGELQAAEAVRAVDPSFLHMFTFPLIKGDPLTALSEPRTMVIAEDIARKYFGDDDPIGKTLTMTLNAPYDFRVTGVMKQLPPNTTLRPRILIPFDLLTELENEEFVATWGNLMFYTYVQLRDGADYTKFSERIAGRIKQSSPGSSYVPYLIPFSGIHLILPSGSGNQMGRVILFGIVAMIILIIASINFVNLMTARAGKRAKEIGVRKVGGACRSDLMKQFYFESLLHAALAGLLAFVMVELLLPVARTLTGDPMALNFTANPIVPLGWIGIIVVTGLLAGTYPALLLSGYKPAVVLKSSRAAGGRRPTLRKVLVVIQFAASMILILGTIGIYRQYGFLENKNLGFNKEQVVVLPLTDKVNFDLLKSELTRNQGLEFVTRGTSSLSGIYQNGSGFTWQGKDPQIDPEVTLLGTDADYLETFQIEMAEGAFFSDKSTEGVKDKIVINEAFAKLMGEGSVIGRTISYGDYVATVIGVAKDFCFKPLTVAVGPLIMFDRWKLGRGTPLWALYARISPNNVDGTLNFMRRTWNTYGADSPFEFHFLADEFKDTYSGFEGLGRILLCFSALAIIISALGLFGLTSYMSEQRTKEIGVRKVLGSSMEGIVWLLTKESFLLISLANGIAIPVAYFALEKWLQRYPYRADVTPLMFLLPVVGLLVIGFVSVAFQAFKAATANPVDSLKYE